MALYRHKTRPVKVGEVPVGGHAPISVQSMTTTKTENIPATLAQIKRLEESGCQIIRVTVPNEEAAKALKTYKQAMTVPLVADIHFNYRMALMAVDAGVDKIRINPGNIGTQARVKEVLNACKERGIPIRIGVNAGSLEKNLIEKYGYPTPEAMVESARRHIETAEAVGFQDIIVSLKASNVPLMIAAYTLFAEQYDYPLHLGVTEAGPTKSGTVKSAIGIGSLLARGIGDTIRVSLTDDPVQEVKAGLEILKSLGLASKGVTLVACPTCGRLEVNLFKIAGEVEKALANSNKTLKIALMGCAVNGPGEAADADIGFAFGKGGGLLYRNGKKVGRIPEEDAVQVVLREVADWEPPILMPEE